MAIRYIDFTSISGTLTGNDWQFTNGSTTVTETGAAGNALAELSAGDYVQTNGGAQWYKVVSVTDDNNFEITPAFQQANNTDTCKYNNEDGSATNQAFCHPNQYTTDNARTAGDIGKMRANQTHVIAGINITTDEDGAVNNYIILKGCDSIDDPWSDASDVQPIIDFSSTNFNFDNYRDFWKFINLEFNNSTDASGALYLRSSQGWEIDNCIFHDNSTGIDLGSYTVIKNCTFYDNSFADLRAHDGIAKIYDSDFYGGVRGITVYGALIYIYDTIFGVTADHSEADIRFLAPAGFVLGRNVKLDSATEIYTIAYIDSQVRIEDDEQTKLANRAWYWNGTVVRGIAAVGGITHWLRAIPNSNCGSEHKLILFEELPLWLPAAQKTITVSMRGNSWAGMPTNSELYIELAYYDGATATRAKVQSTEVLAANDTWTNFTVTITPNSEGPAYLSAYLKDYEDGTESIYVDVSNLPTIT